jgi:hypothetical protein
MHVHVFWLYPILFISHLCKYVCVNALKSLVYVFINMLSLQKSDVLVLETECSGFCGFADKTG